MPEGAVEAALDPKAGRGQQRGQFGDRIGPSHGQRRVVPREPVPHKEVAEQPRAEPRPPPAHQVVDDDPAPSDATHLGQHRPRPLRFEMVDGQGGMGDVECAVGVGQRSSVGHVKGQFRGRGDPRVGGRGRGQDLGPAVHARHRHESTVGAAARDQRKRDVSAAGTHVQDRDPGPTRGEGVDRGCAQPDAAESTVDAGQVAQVPDERPLIVERAVESLPDAGESVHSPADYDASDMSGRARAILPLLVALMAGWLAVVPLAAAAPSYPNQSLGNRGVDVKALQGFLMHRGAPLRVDGVFGATTDIAVRSFQVASGLPVNGQADEGTWIKLVVRVAPGSTSEAVKALQRQLNEKRLAGLAVDGVFGASTKVALLAFQRHAGLAQTGIAGPLTWRYLIRAFKRPVFGSKVCDYQVGNGRADWGTAAAIGQIEAAAVTVVAQDHGRVAIGDIGFEFGGAILGHTSHKYGLDVDVRPMRTDKRQCSWGGSYRTSTYDRAATRDLVKAVRAAAPGHVKLIWFNDPVLVKEGLVRWHSGHDDHLHIRYCEKVHPVAAYDC
jgi:peptidoglycan hydrolase-like protein with peptidoglycan-binding domain